MEGQHQQWGCVGDAISRNTRSIIIRLNTRGSMAQGLSKIGGCSACGGSTPCPKMPCQGSERLWPDTPASIKLSYMIFNLFNTKLLEESCANFIIPQLFSKQILLPDYLRVTSMNSIYYQQSELSLILKAHYLKTAKFRIEKDPRRSWCHQYSRPLSKFEFSHLFFVVDQC